MEDLNKNISYFLTSQKYNFKSLFAYREQTILWSLDSIFTVLSAIIPVIAIYSVSSGINGWSYYQMLLLTGASTMMMGIVYMLISGWQVVQAMQVGSVDMYLMRPYGKLTIILSNFSDVSSITVLLGGALVLLLAWSQLGLGASALAEFALLFGLGIIALVSFLSMLTVLSYHLLRSAQFFYRIAMLSSSVGNYPLTIFGILGKVFFSLVIPIGFAYYYSVNTLLGRLDPVFVAGAVIASAAITVVSYKLFYYLMRKYTSGGG